MRVIAGSARSLRLTLPKGARLRPTSDAMRESLFSSIVDFVPGARFMDVYAGTGAVGIEALSRGAEHCVFVERNHRCVQALRTNLSNTRLSEAAAIVQGDARRVVGRASAEHGPFDVVFADPPYDDPEGLVVAAGLYAPEHLAPGGLLVVQRSREAYLAGLPEPVRVKRFGETELTFYLMPEGVALQ